jgi:hypothetical protein
MILKVLLANSIPHLKMPCLSKISAYLALKIVLFDPIYRFANNIIKWPKTHAKRYLGALFPEDYGGKSSILGRFICLQSLHRRLKLFIGTLKPLKGISLLDFMPILDLFVRILHRKLTGDGSLTWVFVPLLSEDRTTLVIPVI